MLFHCICYVYNHGKTYSIILLFYLQSWFCCCSLHWFLLSDFSNVPRIADTISSKASLLHLYRQMISFSPLFSFFFSPLLFSFHSLFLLINVLFQHNFCLSASVSYCELTFIILTSLLHLPLPNMASIICAGFLYLCSFMTFYLSVAFLNLFYFQLPQEVIPICM